MEPVSSSTNSENQQTLFSKVSQKVQSNWNRVMVPLNSIIEEFKNSLYFDDVVPVQSSKWTSSKSSELMIGGILSTLTASYIALRYFRIQDSTQVNHPLIDPEKTDWKMVGRISLPIIACITLMGILVLKLASTEEKEFSLSSPLKRHQFYGFMSPIKYIQDFKDWLTPTKKQSERHRSSSPIHNYKNARDPSPMRQSPGRTSPNVNRCLFPETPEVNVNLSISGLGRDFEADSFSSKLEEKSQDDEINPSNRSSFNRSTLDFEIDIENAYNHDNSSYPILMQGSGSFEGS